MALPLMPKATAVWLVENTALTFEQVFSTSHTPVENTALTFEQVADFCGLHPLEVQAIADGEVAVGIVGLDPVANGQVTRAEIDRCEANGDARLKLTITDIPQSNAKPKGARYTPVSKRQDRPDAIAWILKHHPEMSDAAISKLIGTTKPTIQSVRDKTHWNATNIKPRNPVTLGMCSEADLEKAVALSGRSRGHHEDVVAHYAEPTAAEE